MNSKLIKERIEWLHYAATGLAANGTEMAMSPQDVIALTECCLAAMDSEPVVFTDERNLHHIVMGRETSLIWGKQNQEAGDIALYRNAQPAPVLPDGLRLALSNAGIAAPESDEMLAATQEKYIQMLVTWVKDRKPFQPAPVVLVMPDFKKLARELVDNLVDCGGLDEGVKEKYLEWAEKACRAAMLQAGNSPAHFRCRPAQSSLSPAQGGNSPAIPEGYVMVPVEPTDEMLHALYHCGTRLIRPFERQLYQDMLAAAPHDTPALNSLQSVDSVVGRWVPVSERMPEEGQHIIIFCDDAFVLFAQHRDGEFFDVVRDGDEFFETTSRCVTHWMPLPAAPQEVK